MLNLALPFRHFGWSLPSQNIKSYIVRDGVTIESYNEMLIGLEEAKTLDRASNLNKIPTLIFLSEDDEVVNNKGVKEWVSNSGLNSWEIVTLELEPKVKKARDHLLINEEMLGEEAWGEMTGAIRGHFGCGSS